MRPALHINLKSAAKAAGVSVPTETADASGSTAKTYTGSAITAIENIEEDKVNISATLADNVTNTPAAWVQTAANGELKATQSGDYEVTFSLKNTYPYADVEWNTDEEAWVHKTQKDDDGVSPLVVPVWDADGLGVSETEAQTEAGYEKLIKDVTVSFTIKQARITASWSGGPNYEYTYNGTAQSPAPTLTGEKGTEKVVLITEYQDKTGAWVTTAPANSGNYTKRIKLDAVSSSPVNANYVLFDGTAEQETLSRTYAIAATYLTVKWYGESNSTTDFSWIFSNDKYTPTAKVYMPDGTTEATTAVLGYTYTLQSGKTGTLETDGSAPLHAGDYVATVAFTSADANANFAFKSDAVTTRNFSITPLAAQNLQWWQDSSFTTPWGSGISFTYNNYGHRPYATAEDISGASLAMSFTYQKIGTSGSVEGAVFTDTPKEAGKYRITAHETFDDYTMTGAGTTYIDYTIDKLSVAVSWDWTDFTSQHIEYNSVAQAPGYSATANNVYTDDGSSSGDYALTLTQVVKLSGVTQPNGAINYNASAYSITVSLSTDDAKNYTLTDETKTFYIDKHTIQADEIHFYNDGTEVSKTNLEFVFGTQPNITAKAIFEVNGTPVTINLIADGNGYNPYYDTSVVPVWPQRAYTYTAKLATADAANFTASATDFVLNFKIVAAKVQAEEMSVVWAISDGAGGYTQITANYQFTYNGAIQKPTALGYFLKDQDTPATEFDITNPDTYTVLGTVGTNYKNVGNYTAWAKPTASTADISYFVSDGSDEFAYEIIAVEVEVEWTVAASYTYIAGTKQGPTLAATTAGATALGTSLLTEFRSVLTVSQAIDAGDQLATATAGKNFVLKLTDGTTGETLTKAFYINKLKLTSAITWLTGANYDEFVYDGNAHVPVYTLASAYATLKIDVTGKQTNAGEYYAFAVLTSDPANRNYELDTTNATHKFVIKPQSVTAVWTDGATDTFKYGYDGTKHEPTATIAAVTLNIDDGTGTMVPTAVTFTVSVTGGETNAGKYSATASITNKNFEISNAEQPYEIEKAAITVTADDKTVTYGAAVPTFTVTVTGSVASTDSATTLVSSVKYKCSYTQYSAVTTTGYAITPYGLDLANYTVTYTAGKLTVNAKAITVALTSHTGTYGDHFHSDFTYTTATGDVVNGDSLGLTYELLKPDATNPTNLALATQITDLTIIPDAGTYIVRAITTGANPNYNFGTIPTATYTIAKRALTVTANDNTITYGDLYDTSDAACWANGVSYSGFVNGDTATAVDDTALTFTYTYTDYANAGAYAITPSGITSKNYDITSYVDGVLTVAPKAVTVTIDDKTSMYGKAEVALTHNGATVALNGDALGITLTRDDASTKDAGRYAIKGAWTNKNYDVTFVEGTYTITPFEIDVVWFSGDVNDPTNFTYTYNAQEQAPVATYIGADGTTEYTLTVSGGRTWAGVDFIAEALLPDSVNYTFKTGTDVTQKYTIDPKPVTVQWYTDYDGTTDTYSGLITTTSPCKYTFANGIKQAPYAKVNGVEAGDTLNIVVIGAGREIGTYEAEAVIVDTASHGNYLISTTSKKIDFEIIAVNASGFAWYKTSDAINAISGACVYDYDGNAHRPVVKSGVNDVYTYTITYADGRDCGGVAIHAGTYKIVAHPQDKNLNVTAAQATMTFVINPMEVTVDWSADTFEYNGGVQVPTASITGAGGLTFTLPVTVDGGNANSVDADTYTARVSLDANGDYTFAAGFDDELTYEITAKQITVVWTSNVSGGLWTMEYDGTALGTSMISATASMTNAVAGESISLKHTLLLNNKPVTNIKNAGTYTLKVELSDANGNYKVVDGEQTFVITKPALTITANSTSVNYGDPKPALSATYSGFVGGEDEESLGLVVGGVTAWLYTEYNQNSSPRDEGYAITIVTATQDPVAYRAYMDAIANYDVTFVAGLITVTAGDGDVKFIGTYNSGSMMVYNGEGQLPKALYKSSKTGDWVLLDVTLMTDGSYTTASSTPAVEVGIYYIQVSKRSDDNDLTPLTQTEWTFEITKLELTVNIADNELTYGDVTQSNYKAQLSWEFDTLGQLLTIYGGNADKAEALRAKLQDENMLGIGVDADLSYDAGNYANAGSYHIYGTWSDDADLRHNYNVKFVGSAEAPNGSNSEGLFVIEKAVLTIASNGTPDQISKIKGDRIIVEVGKLNENKETIDQFKYAYIRNVGYYDAAATISYRRYDLNSFDADEITAPEDEKTYSPDNYPFEQKVGKWLVNYKIDMPNHETYYGQWVIYIEPSDNAITITFVKEYKVTYGDTAATGKDLTAKLLDGYIEIDNVLTKEDFAKYATAHVSYNKDLSLAGVGAYTIEFTFDVIPGSTVVYVPEYVNSNNVDAYVVAPRMLTVDWGETDFTYDGSVKLSSIKPKLGGWINGETLELSGLEVGSVKTFSFSDNGVSDIEVTVTTEQKYDFVKNGGHQLTVRVNNDNYTLDIDNAAKTVSISLDGEPTVVGGLPAWLFWLLIAVAAVAIIGLVILIIYLKKRKMASDDDGFYENVEPEGEAAV